MRDGHPQHEEAHEVVGIGQGLFAGSEQAQDVLQKEHGGRADGKAGDATQYDDVAQYLLGGLSLPGAQLQGRDGGASKADQRTDGDRQVHDREGDGHARKGEVSDAVPDKNAVHDVVQRHDDHPGNGGQ